jgi:hypothetical protein
MIRPYLVGEELETLALAASTAYMKHVDLVSLRQPIVVLDILRGGKYYQLMDAAKAHLATSSNVELDGKLVG